MLYLPITPSWIISRSARRVYLVCTLLALLYIPVSSAMYAIFMLLDLTDATTAVVFAALKWLLFPSIVGAALTWVAMWYHWLTFYRASWIRKSVWAGVMFLLSFFGSSVYYFAVYRPDVKQQLGS